MFRKSKKMHFIGIGGVGMSGIAEILINMGFEVSGSDLKESEQTKHLEEIGAKIFIGHYPSNISDYSVVITSSAIPVSNPEIIEARNRKIPIIHRSEMLAELVRLKFGIGVAGTHGKTTTSSLLSFVLDYGGINPTAIVGGKVVDFGSNARIGTGDYMAFEADESDGSFLKLFPTIAIVTNIDADHLDHYGSFAQLKEAFLQYMNNVPFYGYSVACLDDPNVAEVLKKVERPYITYGFNENADFCAKNVQIKDGKVVYDCYYQQKLLGSITNSLLGNHNVVNSLAVVAVASELGIDFKIIAEALAKFKGVGRRLEVKGEVNGVRVLDDYGHHPTEIRATLAALHELDQRLVVLFQPHRYSRTQLLWDEFGQAFGDADKLFLTSIYPAGEAPIEGVSSDLIVRSVKKHENREVQVLDKFEEIPAQIAKELKPGDIFLTLGAGDICKIGSEVLQCLSAK